MRLFAFFGSLIVLALAAALIVPPYVDWNQFKDRFEQEASRALGLPVKVLGQTSARLLPLPSVTFTNLEIGAAEARDPILTAQSFKLDVELAPLLKGDVVIVDMQLSYPSAELALDDQGKLALPTLSQRSLEIENADVAVENISINNGVFQFRDGRTGRKLQFQDIDLQASAKQLTGPWRARGLATHNGERIRFTTSTGLWQPTQQMRVKLEVEPLSLPYDFEIEGPLKIVDRVPEFSGLFRMGAMGRQSDEDLISFRRPGADKALPIRVESDLIFTSGGASVPAFKLDVGDSDDPYSLTGNGQAIFADEVSFRIRAEGQQINVARLESVSGKGIQLAQRIDAVRSILSNVPRFEADGEINLYLPAVIAGDTVIREVGMDLRPADDGEGWQVNNLEAQLPGRTDLRADGQLILGAHLGYEGELIVASRQPSGLAKWLGAEITPAMRDLSSAGFSAQAKISSSVLQFDDAEIILDGKRLTGSVKRKSEEQRQPILTAKLQGEAVNFDQLNGLLSLFSGGDSSNIVSHHHLDLDLNVQSMTLAGLSARDVVAKLQLNRLLADVEVEQLRIGDIAGTALSLDGKLKGWMPGNNDLVPEGRLTFGLQSKNPAGFLDLINRRFGPYPVLPRLIDDPQTVAETDIKIDLSAIETGGFQMNLSGAAGGSAVEGKAFGTNSRASLLTQEMIVSGVLDNPDASALLLQLGVPVVPLESVGRGALRFTGRGSLEGGFGGETALTLRNGYVSAEGRLKPLFGAETLNAMGEADVTLDITDADNFILLSGLPVPGFGDGNQAKLKMKLKLEETAIEATDIAGNVAGAKVTGNLKADLSRKPRPMLTGTLDSSVLDLQALSELVFTGGAEFQENEGARTVFSGLDGDVQLSAGTARLTDELPTLERMQTMVSLRDGDIALEDFKVDWLAGNANGTVSMARSNSDWILNGQLKLDDADLTSFSLLSGLPNGLSGKLDVQGTFETAGKSYESMISQLTASGTAALKSATVKGLNSGFFKNVLAAADAVKDEEVAGSANAILTQNLDGAAFEFEDIDVPYTVASGLARINNLTLKGEGMQITGAVRHSLQPQTSAFDGRVRFDPGKEVVVGATPEFDLKLNVADGLLKHELDTSLFATYLGMRISERREREFDAQRAAILERQRLLQTARIYALEEEARRIAIEERERIKQLEREQEELRKREEARRKREELERKRLQAELERAEKEAAREAAVEAGRRERRQKQIELLRKKSEEAAKRLQFDLNPVDAEN